MSIYSPKMAFLLQSDRFVVESVASILQRIFLGNGINDVYAIEFIRDGSIQHRLGFLHLRDILASVPGAGGGVPFSHELYLLLNPRGFGTTYATGTYITKAYVDFGILGVTVIFFILGVCVGVAQKLLFQRKVKTPMMLALTAMISYQIGTLVLKGPISLLVSMMALLCFCAVLAIASVLWRMNMSVLSSSRKLPPIRYGP